MLSTSIFYGLISMLGYGFLNILNGKAAKSVGAYRLGFLVQVGGFFITAMLFPIFGKTGFSLVLILLLSVCGFLSALTYLTFMKAFEKGSVSIVTPIVSSWAIITSILSFIFLREKIVSLKLLGIMITIFGVVLVSTNIKKILKEKRIKLIAGAEWAGLTALGWGVNFFLVSFFSKKLGWYITNIGLRFWVFVSLLAISFFLKKNIVKLISAIPRIIYVIAVADVIVYAFLNIGLEKGEASIVAVLTSASTLITVLLSIYFIKEKLTSLQKLGALLCFFGIGVLTLS